VEQGKKNGVDATKLQACINAQDETAVKASSKEGDDLGVDSTPTLFINGEKIAGAVPPEILMQIIDRALRSEGVAVPTKTPANAGGVKPNPAAATEKK
jgi:protein-disulfide isomerase